MFVRGCYGAIEGLGLDFCERFIWFRLWLLRGTARALFMASIMVRIREWQFSCDLGV